MLAPLMDSIVDDSTPQQTFWIGLLSAEDKGLRERLLVLQESCGLVVVEALFFGTACGAGPTADVGRSVTHGRSHYPW